MVVVGVCGSSSHRLRSDLPCSNAQHVLFPLKICSPQMKSPIPTAKYCKINRRIEVEMLLHFELSSCFWACANLCLDTHLAGCLPKFDNRSYLRAAYLRLFYQ